MMRWATLLGLLGLAGATALFVWQGVAPVLAAFTSAGFGIVIVALSHFLSMGLNARAWQILTPQPRPSTFFFTWAVWLREAVNGMLPVARIGGEIATAQILIKKGLSAPWAVAGLIADVTLSLGSQLLFTLLGVALLLTHNQDTATWRNIVIGMAVFVPMLLVFVLVQRKGLFAFLAKFAKKLFGERFAGLVQDAESLDRTLADVYERRTAVVMCVVWQLLGWCAGALEIWLALYVLGFETSLTNAVIIESLIQAISSSAFIVPGALGVQEGGFVIVGGFLGVPRETALALALMRRARDILLFLPALAAWQYSLGKRLFRASLKNE